MTAIEVGHGSPVPNPTNTGGGKKSQIEGFGSVLVFASGVITSFRFHSFPMGDRISSPREGERARERERVTEFNAGK